MFNKCKGRLLIVVELLSRGHVQLLSYGHLVLLQVNFKITSTMSTRSLYFLLEVYAGMILFLENDRGYVSLGGNGPVGTGSLDMRRTLEVTGHDYPIEEQPSRRLVGKKKIS